MTIKIRSWRIRVRDHERAEQSNSPLGARGAEQSLRSSLTSGRGSLLAHMLVMLGSLTTMLVFARLIANPGIEWPKSQCQVYFNQSQTSLDQRFTEFRFKRVLFE